MGGCPDPSPKYVGPGIGERKANAEGERFGITSAPSCAPRQNLAVMASIPAPSLMLGAHLGAAA